MKFRSVLRRLAVTLPFFLTAGVILRVVAVPLDTAVERRSPLVLIVTTEGLHPAFRALEHWNATQGCRTRIVTLDPGVGAASVMPLLGQWCRQSGATGVLLGGDREVLPGLPAGIEESSLLGDRESVAPRVVPEPAPAPGAVPQGVRIGRAPVRNLGEAWAFVDACRTSGRTLDQLIGGPLALGSEELAWRRHLVLAQLPAAGAGLR